MLQAVFKRSNLTSILPHTPLFLASHRAGNQTVDLLISLAAYSVHTPRKNQSRRSGESKKATDSIASQAIIKSRAQWLRGEQRPTSERPRAGASPAHQSLVASNSLCQTLRLRSCRTTTASTWVDLNGIRSQIGSTSGPSRSPAPSQPQHHTIIHSVNVPVKQRKIKWTHHIRVPA